MINLRKRETSSAYSATCVPLESAYACENLDVLERELDA